MPVRGTGTSLDEGRWIGSFRTIDDIDVDRARQRWTLSYRLHPRLQAGVEWNPLGDDIGPIANWIAIEEKGQRPALLIGTSSDRIGTDTGQVYYATVSKNLDGLLGVPISPYVGASWSDRTNRWQELAGLQYRILDKRVSITHLWDGVNLHHTADFGSVGHLVGVEALNHTTVGLIAAEQDGDYFYGLTIGIRF